jgi:hypothetical protein
VSDILYKVDRDTIHAIIAESKVRSATQGLYDTSLHQLENMLVRYCATLRGEPQIPLVIPGRSIPELWPIDIFCITGRGTGVSVNPQGHSIREFRVGDHVKFFQPTVQVDTRAKYPKNSQTGQIAKGTTVITAGVVYEVRHWERMKKNWILFVKEVGTPTQGEEKT